MGEKRDELENTENTEKLTEEINRLKIENKKLNRQLNLANDNMIKYRNVTSAKTNLSAIIAAEKSKQEQQLVKALNDATSASKAKSEFLANMSHEIRTPLNAIVGMTSIGMSATDVERKDYSFAKIYDASRHLLGVINDILDMSKIEAGRLELAPAEFDFEKILKRAINVVNFSVEEKSQNFTVYVDRAIPKILIGDEQRLAQVITNLLGNAVKFTPENGSIFLNTYFLGEEAGICEIKIAVKDTGIGMSPEQQAKLFQSFQQAETSTTRKFGGTGLGLSISKCIVEMMGGKIWIESELGHGATVAFVVKVQRGENKPVQRSQVDWSTVKILVVDDSKYVLQDFQGIIRKLGGSCDIAISAAEALALIEKKGDYNIYFIDWKMSGMDGIELAEKLKKMMPENSGSMVIMISAADNSEVAGKAKEAGFAKLLQKPLFPSTIEEIISDYMGTDKTNTEGAKLPEVGLFEGYRILLAEDMEINREIVLALLEPTGIAIDCALNGVEALDIISRQIEDYDLVFMDMQMPEMDGLEATRQIRALDSPKAKSIPIVAMTANVFKEDIESCHAAGMNAHIGKPLDFEEVIATLGKYLKNIC